jgi:hypothetical protein
MSRLKQDAHAGGRGISTLGGAGAAPFTSPQCTPIPAARQVTDSPDNTLLAHVPAELRDRPQWVGCHITPSKDRPGKTAKLPIDPQTGSPASSTDNTTWGTFDQALAAVQHFRLRGVGFVFSDDDPYTGIDLDHCFPECWRVSISFRAGRCRRIGRGCCGSIWRMGS